MKKLKKACPTCGGVLAVKKTNPPWVWIVAVLLILSCVGIIVLPFLGMVTKSFVVCLDCGMEQGAK